MGIILNIETATTVCSVSLAKEGNLLALKEQNGDYSHAENLTLFIQDVCLQANLQLSDIDAIAVSKGPGSYTGLRIGVSTAKGLCYSLNKPLIAVNTLQHIALSISSNIKSHSSLQAKLSDSTLFCPMLDARRMEVYCAIFDSSNKEIQATSAEIIDKQSFAELLKKHQILFFGDGAEKCKETLSQNKNAHFLDSIFPSSKNMVSLSELAFSNNNFEDVAYFEPFYLKDFMLVKKTEQ